jgi:hypothetical protein
MFRKWLRRFQKSMPPPSPVMTVVTPDGKEHVRDSGQPFIVNGDVLVTVLVVSGDCVMLSVGTPRHADIHIETAGGVPLPGG